MKNLSYACKEFLKQLALFSGSPGKAEKVKERAFNICKDYVGGRWKMIDRSDFAVHKLSGGLSNMLYLCKIKSDDTEDQVLLRFFGQSNNETRFLSENIIFTMLAERELGPKLLGIFPGGRIEQYIPGRSLQRYEMMNVDISKSIATNLGTIHSLTIPICKEATWMWDQMKSWLSILDVDDKPRELARTLNRLNKECDWLKSQVLLVNSPVVFCHNDLQQGNILIKNNDPNSVTFIDFEYSAYNYRAFDLANHFSEWTYDYNTEKFPHFLSYPENYPGIEEQKSFVREYMKSYSGGNENEQHVDTVMEELKIFRLAPHLLWAIWALVNSKSSKIEFGYYEYFEMRLEAYKILKRQLLE